MSQHSIPVSPDHATTPVEITVYQGAKAPDPIAHDTLTWAELGDEIEALIAEPAASKEAMRALGPYRLREGTTRANRNVERMGAVIALDVDHDLTDLDSLLNDIRSLGVAAIVYTSPSDPNPDGSRRVRIFLLSEPHAPEQCWPVRRAAAALLGVTPDKQTKDPSRILFAGMLEGSADRECHRIDGEPLALAWLDLQANDPTPAPRAQTPRATPSSAAPGERVARVIAIVEPHYTENRHELVRALASWLATYPLGAWSDAEIASVVHALPSNQTAKRVRDALEAATQARSGAVTIGWQTLSARLGPVDSARLEGAARSAWWVRFLKGHPVNDSGPDDSGPDDSADADVFAPAADSGDEPDGPYILQSTTHAETILLWRGADRGHQPVALGSLRTVIKDAGLDEQIPLYEEIETPGGKSKVVKLNAPTIVERHGRSFDNTTYDFARRVSEYDEERSLVTVGYPDASPAGAFDPDVDRWLRALAGDAYARLAVWIASCAQRHIDRLAAALVLIGSADTGKSLFSCAVAGLWGAFTPPAASLLIKQFNGELRKCAVVVDEEAQLFGSKQLSTKRFRDLTQSTERSIELKGLETFTLRGALRIVVPCNEISDLRFTDLGGPDIVKALTDRLCVINCKPREAECKAALVRLRLPVGYKCDRDRVIAHMAWLCETVELPAERFLGAGAGADSVLAGHVRDTADLWETFHAWLDALGAGPTTFWSVHAGRRFCVNPSKLALALEKVGRGWDLQRVRAALEPFHQGDYHPRGEPRLWVVDARELASALALDADRLGYLEEKLSGGADKFKGFKRQAG